MKQVQTPQTGVHRIRVEENYAGQRLDNFLLNYLKGVPKSMIYRIVRKGEVRVNRGRVAINYRIQAGDEVRIPPVRRETTPASPDAAKIPSKLREQIENSIIHEDKRLLVINKPAGIAVHGGSGIRQGVIEILRALHPAGGELELVHRLDRETSGCLMITKRRSALRTLHELIRQDAVTKRYLALVKGAWPESAKSVDVPLLKNTLKSGERIVTVDAAGKPSRTDVRIVERFDDFATLLELELRTGRTHQIRVHTQYSGHPIACDGKYGDTEFNQKMRKSGLSQMFLHARELAFRWPENGERCHYVAPLPDALQQSIKRLRHEKTL